MHKGFIQTGASIGALSIIIGAFAAHSLKPVLSADQLQIFETAVRYQFYHVIALLLTGILYKDFPGKILTAAGYFFIAGIILFSGSLYGLCYIKYQNLPGLLWTGVFTPIGGLCFIIGWVLVFFGVSRKY